jgi:hypothetical protein
MVNAPLSGSVSDLTRYCLETPVYDGSALKKPGFPADKTFFKIGGAFSKCAPTPNPK